VNSFELSFGLTSVILGLALTHLANAVRKLLLRGRAVIWAPEPLLLAGVILLIIVSSWMHQFSRNTGAPNDGVALLNVLRMLTLYFAAGFCLPEPEPGEPQVDLLRYYDRTRRFTYGSLIAGLTIFFVYNTVVEPAGWRADLMSKLLPIAVWVALMFVRWRWLSLLLLAIPIFGTANDIMQASLGR
jgi:hypothetical protein